MKYEIPGLPFHFQLAWISLSPQLVDCFGSYQHLKNFAFLLFVVVPVTAEKKNF